MLTTGMTSIEQIFGWVRILMYLFTVVSLVMAGISFLTPMPGSKEGSKLKAALMWSLAAVFLLFMISAILRVTGQYPGAGLWIISYPVRSG